MNITLSGQGDTRPNRRLLAAGRVNINLRTPKCASIRCLAGHQNTVIGGQRSFVSQICDSARHSLHLGPAVIFSYI